MMTQLALFYDTLDTETRIIVRQRTTEIKALMKRAAVDLVEAGAKCAEVQALLRHNKAGGFDKWIKHENLEARTVYRLLDVWKAFGNLDNLSKLEVGISALYLLAAPSTPDGAREEAIERAEAGEQITHSVAREIVQEHRTPTYEPDREWTPDTQDVFADTEAEEYEDVIEERQASPMAVHFSSEDDKYNTPPHIIERVIALFGQIDIDPCSNSHEAPNVPALEHFTWEDDGLNKRWHGRIYMNPPYGDEIGHWTERLWRAYQDSEIAEAIALLPARTDTKWFEPLWNYPMCFIYRRLKFSNAESGAPFPSVVVYMGRDTEGFREHFEDIGRTGRLQ